MPQDQRWAGDCREPQGTGSPVQNPCPTSACSLSTGLSLSKTRLPRVLCSGSPALTCFSVSLSPGQNFQLLCPDLEAASHADVYRLRQSQVNHSWPAMNWKVRIVSKSSLVFVCFVFFVFPHTMSVTLVEHLSSWGLEIPALLWTCGWWWGVTDSVW